MSNGLEPIRRRVGEVSLHAVEAGPPDGPLAILLHGFPEFWYGWRRQIGPLAAASLRVVAPDQRGYNLSDKPQGVESYAIGRLAADVVGLADALGRERFFLVGHDWGGMVAWRVAARHPDRVERLAILNAPHPRAFGPYARHHPGQALRSAYVGFFQLPFIPEAALRAGGFALLRQALLRSSRPGAFTPEDLARYEAAWREPGALTAMLNWYRAIRLRPARDGDEGRIRCPTLVIWGRRDSALESGLAEASAALCDDARIVWHDNATHWVQHEEPEAVSAALAGFLAG
ncbi:MAG TPA: alpha/beta hydrolase [Beijerinckiaceae bacterium]|jgi:pimeloyl-ACP methyl ester carboxylesterase